jgi:hypothetical protein
MNDPGPSSAQNPVRFDILVASDHRRQGKEDDVSMPSGTQKVRLRFGRWRIGPVLVCMAALGACGRQPLPVPTPPPPEPSPFAIADEAFEHGEFAAAAPAYRRALAMGQADASDDRARALLRLSFMHAVPESSIWDIEQARSYLDQLVSEYPEAPEAGGVEALLELQSTVVFLQTRLAGLQATVSRLQSATVALEVNRNEQSTTIEDLTVELEHVSQQLAATETELSRLKEIDLGRRRVN